MAKKTLKKIIEKVSKVEKVEVKTEPIKEEVETIIVPKIEKEYIGGKLVTGKKTIEINGREVTELSLEDGSTTIL